MNLPLRVRALSTSPETGLNGLGPLTASGGRSLHITSDTPPLVHLRASNGDELVSGGIDPGSHPSPKNWLRGLSSIAPRVSPMPNLADVSVS